MRGDFLGQASLAWSDLEIGQDLNLSLVQREGGRGKPVNGTIRLMVGEPLPEVIEQEQSVTENATVTTAVIEQPSSVPTAERQVCVLGGYLLWFDLPYPHPRFNTVHSHFRSMPL